MFPNTECRLPPRISVLLARTADAPLTQGRHVVHVVQFKATPSAQAFHGQQAHAEGQYGQRRYKCNQHFVSYLGYKNKSIAAIIFCMAC